MAIQSSSSLHLDTGTEPPLPPIAAAFIVNFDHRKGYTLGWHKSLDDVQVEGVVEFKSLPSGLHNVEEDLIYFIHDGYAGLSAFINKADERSDRAARMLAVGILVPLEHGRMGRSWRHAEALKELARSQIDNPANTTAIEEYWEQYRLKQDDRALQDTEESVDQDQARQPNGYNKSRSMSTATTFVSSHHSLTPHHPALTLINSIKLFGPLIFPLYRAALLRKRILIVTETPVETTCNLVYNLSILSSVSKSLLSLLPEAGSSTSRLRPLFTVGVMDIPLLEQEKDTNPSRSFIACTTDDVLASKPDLFDVLVLMPKSDSQNAATKVFPRIVLSSPELTKTFPKVGVRATQRDSHRLSHLLQGLRRFQPSEETAGHDETSSILSNESSYSVNKAVVEPSSWSRMAYTSLVWWASAGDRRTGFSEIEETETERDLALLRGEDEEGQTREVAVVAYFHRLTTSIFTTMANAITRTDEPDQGQHPHHDEDEDEDDASPIIDSTQEESQPLCGDHDQESEVDIFHEDMAEMGLDGWSASDRKFVQDLMLLWWKRKANVRPTSIECCGLRIL